MHDSEGVQFIAFGDLHGGAEFFLHRLGEGLAGVAAIDEHAGDLLEVVGAAVEGGQGTRAVGHLGCRDGQRMRQAPRIDGDVALDAGSGPGSLHFWKYEWTVRHLGNSPGSIRHWQLLLSTYSTPENTSYISTVRGLVRRRTPPNNGRTRSNCPRLTSLPYTFFLIQKVSTQSHASAS